MSLEELKPCPFCGHEIAPRLIDSERLCLSVAENAAVICCFANSGCGAMGGFERTESAAIEKWNKRSPTTGAKQ